MKFKKNMMLIKIFLYILVLNGYFTLNFVWGESGKIYISNKFNNGLYVLDENNLDKVNVLSGERASAEMMAATDNKIIFIEPGAITILDKNLSKIADVDFDAFPAPGCNKAIISSDQKRLYIGFLGWGKVDNSGVFVVNIEEGKAVKMLKEPYMHSGFIGISDDGKYLYIPEKLNRIQVLDLSSFISIKTISLDSGDQIREIIGSGQHEIYTAVNSAFTTRNITGKLYVKLKKIDDNGTVLKEASLPSEVYRIVLSSDKKKLYALCRNKLVEIDATSFLVFGEVGVDGENLALSSNGKKAFVISASNNQLIVIDLEKNTVLRTMTIGEEPYEIMVK